MVSFILGSFGYVIVQFWVRPIFKYRTIRKDVIQNLADYLNSFDQEDEGENFHGVVNNKAVNLRRRSSDLIDCYHNTLPKWYQVFLRGRGEFPDEIIKHLMALSNTRNYHHARNRMEKIRLLFKA
ncbi:MAG: hypothetical protein C4522_04680 [Desulfobacteraceae bacterium]|nr:MAG: hypothetical protein C4522_04680 [Desulfobacteraceae bacterium]